ncbi:hypothetical protein GCM10028806_04410 [Spirosoma terrae]|uniref:PKD domain-containing protein n=1 Tax=Spirosoma terrae TaxID=1968276 RepID=A0A6L9LI32_9BACT|nr:LamG-like jellyroll fold domain-containing protein [Spirosoma terrae]NDU98318.1 PKD domain-containing protein [Spirosoma terrae]
MKSRNISTLFSLIFCVIGGLFLWACDPWELPGKKSKRECTPPSGNLAAQIQQRKVDFSIANSAGTIDQISWNFGNGSSTETTGTTASYTYPTSGTYTVTANLSNTCKQSITLTREIVVSDAVPPTVTLQPATDINPNTANIQMTVTANGNATITEYGITYSKTSNPPVARVDATIPISASVALNTSIPFSLTGLDANTVYYVRSYARNSAGIGYSSVVQNFRTGTKPAISITGNPTAGVSTAAVNFVLNNAGNPAAVTYGVLYSSTSSTPDMDNAGPGVTVSNPNVGANTAVNLTNLQPNTTYYCRPYAKLASGEIVYGDIVSFKTQIDTVADGLVAYLHFTNRSLVDATGNGNDAILVDNPGFTTDRRGNPNAAILLDGINDYFYMAENSTLRPDAFTISIWIRPSAINNVNNRMQIYNKSRWSDSNFEMYSSLVKINETGPGLTFMTNVKQNSNCEVAKGWQSFQFSNNPTLDQWHHLVLVYSGRTSKMYFDNALMDQNNNLPANNIDKCPGGELKFGAQIKDFPNYFKGAMDEIRIYRRALSDSEIQTLYNQ